MRWIVNDGLEHQLQRTRSLAGELTLKLVRHQPRASEGTWTSKVAYPRASTCDTPTTLHHQHNAAKMGNANSQMLENIVQGSNCTFVPLC
jgi:hypothetical protein